MIGRCIRTRDNKSLVYKLKVEKWQLKIYINDDQWKLIEDREDFNRDYEFQDELSVGIVFHILFSLLIEDESSMEVIKILNQSIKEDSVAKKILEFEEIIRVICIKDTCGSDVDEAPDDDDKIFIRKNIYQGVHFSKCYYMLISEKISVEEVTDECVNGKIAVTFRENDKIKANFSNHFFIMNPDETKSQAWKRYQVKTASERFDM